MKCCKREPCGCWTSSEPNSPSRNGRDRFYLEAIGIAAGDRSPSVFSALQDSEPTMLNARGVKLLQILKPENDIDILREHLSDRDLTASTATAIVDALGWMDNL